MKRQMIGLKIVALETLISSEPFTVSEVICKKKSYPTGTPIALDQEHRFEIPGVTYKEKTETISGKITSSEHPVTISPYVAWVEKEVVSWAHKKGFITEEGIVSLKAAHFGLLAAACYPNALPKDLLVHAKLITWLFFHDDMVDKPIYETAKNSRTLQKFNDKFLNILDGNPIPDSDSENPFVNGFLELDSYYRNAAKENHVSFEPFKLSIKQYLQSTFNLVKKREKGEMSSNISLYRKSRDFTSAVETVMEAGMIADAVSLTDQDRTDLDVKSFFGEVNICVCDNNDIRSVKKELRADPQYVENIVLVHLRAQEMKRVEISIATAVEDSLLHLNTCREELLKTAETLRQLGKPHIDAFVIIGLNWDSGCLFWHELSGRYD
jgi:hypothetical protein